MKAWEIVKPALPSLVWGVLVLAGVVVLVFFSGERKPAWPTATRTLPANTYLVTGELQQAGLSGRYIIAPGGVKQGDPVRPQDIGDQPQLPPAPPVKLLLSLPLAYTDVVTGTNAASTAQLCGKAPLSFGSVAVDVVRCDQSDKPTCSAIVEVPPAAAADLAAEGLKDTNSTSELHLAATCN